LDTQKEIDGGLLVGICPRNMIGVNDDNKVKKNNSSGFSEPSKELA
jgi:hypothetical protein